MLCGITTASAMTEKKKIKPLTEMVLIIEIVNQARFAEKAADQLSNTSDPVEVWGSIQSILVATANVSKILWPAKKESKARGKQLRDDLGVSDDNLLSDRTIRNHFEHYDERIEEWVESGKSGSYMDSRIDPFPTQLSREQFCHRSYNPTNKMLSFRGESIDLAAVLAELAKIREKCRFWDLP
jgi:hypothetical protein